MPLTPGARLGPYEVVASIGAGGMGEVYRARDTRLDRIVALKVLPEGLAADPQFRDRFDREARAISQLSHPHICPLFDVGQQNGVHFLVMEYLEGETLAERLDRSKDRLLPRDIALGIAAEIAGALDAAHRPGIVHRDLKPGNVMLTKTGAKLLDFGLAKTGAGKAGGAGRAAAVTLATLTSPPTMTTPLTEAGSILGTIQYMSPEQLHGNDADARSDIFSFGAVLYEMLTGRKAFQGKSQVGVMAAILEHEPEPLATLQPRMPPALVRLVTTCLAKDPDARWQSARDLARELEYIAGQPAAEGPTAAKTVAARGVRPAVALAGALAIAGLSVLGTWASLRRPAEAKPPPVRFTILPRASQPTGHYLALAGNEDLIALSPDGQSLVYVASIGEPILGASTTQLMVRRLNQTEPTLIPNLGAPRAPFISPDGKWIGYFDGQTALKKVSINGGAPITICALQAPGRGATWAPDNTIVFATPGNQVATTLFSVSAGGGDPVPVARRKQGEEGGQLYPFFLPNGHAVLYASSPAGGSNDSTNFNVSALDLRSGQQKVLIRGGTHPAFIELSGAGGRGYLVYAVSGSLRAVGFDPDKLEVVGDPVPALDGVRTVGGAAQFVLARNGTLVYVPGSDAGIESGLRSLTWFDRSGREDPIAAPARAYAWARLSPDGTRIALDIREQQNDIWTFDINQQRLTRVTTDPATEGFPIWTPDGRAMFFESSRVGSNFKVFRQSADGTGTAEQLTKSANPMWATSLSRDGVQVIVQETAPATGRDIDVLALDGHSDPTPLIHTSFNEMNGELSPDGHWLAYQSNESGVDEVYVRPFPDVDSGRFPVSTRGGRLPAWAANGRELYYLAGRDMMAVPVQTPPSFSTGTPMKLFEAPPATTPPMRYYDVTRDGKKFLLIKNPPASIASASTMVVILNWVEEVKAKILAR